MNMQKLLRFIILNYRVNKVIFIHNNYEPEHIPGRPDPEDRFYTYGFGSNIARNFKKYYPEYKVEMWRVDTRSKEYHEKIVQNVLFRIFSSVSMFGQGEFSLKFIRELRKEIKKNKPLLFISHTHTWLLYQVALFFKKSPIVTSHHGDWSPFFRIKHRKGLKKLKDFLDTLIERLVMKNVDYFLVCDYNHIPYIKKAAPKSRFEIYSTGLNMEGFEPVDRNEARRILGWDKNKKYILYLGKLYEFKQPKELIDIWIDIKKNRPEVELVIIGNTPEDEFYDYAVNSGAMVLGRILNKNLNIYYSAADVYVLVALREDYFGGTGIAPLESLAVNTPVVSYSMRNYVGNNISELGEVPDTLEGYKKAILKVIDNPQLYKNMRKSVEENYSYEKVAGRTESVFRELSKIYN